MIAGCYDIAFVHCHWDCEKSRGCNGIALCHCLWLCKQAEVAMALHLVIASEFAAERTNCGPERHAPQEDGGSEIKNHSMAPNSGIEKVYRAESHRENFFFFCPHVDGIQSFTYFFLLSDSLYFFIILSFIYLMAFIISLFSSNMWPTIPSTFFFLSHDFY